MRSDMKISIPSPPPEPGDPAAESSKGKRLWSKPKIKLIEVEFTHAGFNDEPTRHEGLPSPGAQVGSTYRTS